VDGNADVPVEARIRVGWNKFKQLVPLLANRMSLIIRGNSIQQLCAKSSVTWK